MIRAYKLEFKLDVFGYWSDDCPVSISVVGYERRPGCKKFGDKLDCKMNSSMGFTWAMAEVWQETEFSETEIDDFLSEFREWIYKLTSDMNKNVGAKPNIYRHY